jgi:hypothetical protein
MMNSCNNIIFFIFSKIGVIKFKHYANQFKFEFFSLKIITLPVILFCFNILNLKAQPVTIGSLKANTSVASPEAAAMFKFSDIPVSEYTGVPNVNIPITSFQNGNINVDVSLSYHSAGHKVSEHANWVGLGWKINAGGMISRKVKGLPDDSNRGVGFLEFRKTNTEASIVAKHIAVSSDYAGVLDDLKGGCSDAEPDEFYFDVNGYSGKFAFDWIDNQSTATVFVPVVSSTSPVKIKGYTDVTLPGSKKIIKWELIAPDGTIYTFAAIETTVVAGSKSCSGTIQQTYTSSWYLTRITNANNVNQYVEFQYDEYVLQNDWLFYEVNTMPLDPVCALAYPASPTGNSGSSSNAVISGQRIKSIIAHPTNIRVDFNANALRTDIINGSGNSNNKHLDEVVISGINDVPKKINLTYVYQGQRLTLKSIFESAGIVIKPAYEFFYNGAVLPYRLSKSIDHWGFSNGKNNSTLIPATDFVMMNNTVVVRGAADRRPSENEMKAQILERITYPTGGISELVYEPHDYSFIQSSPLVVEYEQVERDESVSAVSTNASVMSKEITLTNTNGTVVSISMESVNNSCIDPGDGGVFCSPGNIPEARLYEKSGNDWVVKLSYKPRSTGQELLRLKLKRGIYKIEAKTNFWTNNGLANGISLNLNYTEDDSAKPIIKKMAGGLRIKEIKTYKDATDNSPIIQTYSYKMNANGRDTSSGVLNGEPIYETLGTSFTQRGSDCVNMWCLISSLVGSNVILLGETNGSHVGYRKVTVTSGNGKKIKEFTSPYEYPDYINNEKPYAHPVSNSHKTGLLKSEKIIIA